MTPYTELPGFEHLYLEDSFVLDIEVHPGMLTMRMDFVLTENHPEYSVPGADEQYCYRSGVIRFQGLSRLHWLGGGLPPATDANDETDYGGIDEFGQDGDTFVIAGEFGQIDLAASTCAIALDDG